MAKNQNTYAKRKREMDKKLKAEAKRERRKKRKEGGGDSSAADALVFDEDGLAVAPDAPAVDVEPETLDKAD